jgi:hypothetical protein
MISWPLRTKQVTGVKRGHSRLDGIHRCVNGIATAYYRALAKPDRMPEHEICAQCGTSIDDGVIFCRMCGATLRSPAPLIAPSADDVTPSRVSVVTRIVVTVVRGVAGIAAVVAIFCPLGTWAQILTFIGSAVVFLICHAVLSNLDDNYFDENAKDGYWPAKPVDWGPPPDRLKASEKRENS